MNSHDAKFLLRACRPDGRDAADPMFSEALAEAERNPHLRAWWEQERAVDVAMAAKLQEIAPPPDLKKAILAGARVSRPRPEKWWTPTWIAAAAGLAVLFTVVALWRESGVRPLAAEFARFAQLDLVAAHDGHVGEPPGLAEVQSGLARLPAPLRSTLQLNPQELQQKRCRTVRLGGQEVFEICFQREGVWYHLYAMSAEALTPAERGRLHVRSDAGVTAAVWTNAGMAYALVSRAAPDAVRRLL